MAHNSLEPRDSFSSKFGVIAAAAGSAIGLGNIWRFPYILGENGGGAFLLVYLVFIIAIGVPVMMSEFVIGRNAQRNPVGAFKKIRPGKPWYLVGLLGVVSAFIILAFYTVVAGWTLEYLVQSVIWLVSPSKYGFSSMDTAELRNFFTDQFHNFQHGSWRPVIWFGVIMIFTGLIVISGVKDGIEKYAKILMPLLLVLLIVLVIRALTLDGARQGVVFLFKPDFSLIKTSTVLEALGQAFFSLSIGMGTLITYGSYIPRKENLGSTALNVALADTFIAVIAGLAIFPAVFAFNISPDAGPDLVYITLPVIFSKMTAGMVWAFIFFLLLCFAAVTSTISVLEVIVAYFSEELKMKRRNATILAMISVGFLGLLCTFSWNVLSDFRIMGKTVFGLFNASPDILLPLGGLFIVVFVGWIMQKKVVKEELSSNGIYKVRFMNVFIFLVKFVAPLAIAIVFLNGLGILRL